MGWLNLFVMLVALFVISAKVSDANTLVEKRGLSEWFYDEPGNPEKELEETEVEDVKAKEAQPKEAPKPVLPVTNSSNKAPSPAKNEVLSHRDEGLIDVILRLEEISNDLSEQQKDILDDLVGHYSEEKAEYETDEKGKKKCGCSIRCKKGNCDCKGTCGCKCKCSLFGRPKCKN